MEEVFEIVLEILMEGSLAICRNKKISRWIRWPIFIVLVLFLTAVIVGIFLFGVYMYHQNIAVSLLFLAIALFLLGGCVWTFFKQFQRID